MKKNRNSAPLYKQKDLLQIIEELDEKGVHVHSLHESFDTLTPQGKLMLTMISALSQFERDVLYERTREGLKSARARGHMGGRPSADKDKLEMAFKLYDEGSTPVKDICDQFGISKTTFFKYNRMRKGNEK